jgi:hypothetical protein
VKRELVAIVGLVAAVGCGGRGAKARVPDTEPELKRALAAKDGGAGATSHHAFIADVPDGAIGPHWARGASGGLAAYIGPPEVDVRGIVVAPLTDEGEAKSPPGAVAAARVDASSLVVRALAKSYFVGWTELTDKGEALRAVIVGEDGKPFGKAFEVNRTPNDIVWFDAKQTDKGSLVVWAESTKDGLANVTAEPLGADGVPSQVAVRVAQGVLGWQVAAADGGVALFLTTPKNRGQANVTSAPNGSATGTSDRESGGPESEISVVKLGSDGQPLAAPLVIAQSTRGGGDVDAVRLASSWLVAWTERGPGPALVTTALVRDGAAGPQITRLTDGTSPAELIAVGANGDDSLVAWAEPSKKSRALKNVYFAHASSQGVDPARVSAIETSARGVELARAGAGFGLVAEVSSCTETERSAPEAPCEAMHPALMSIAKGGGILARSVLSLGASAPNMAWDAQCDDKGCSMLAAEAAGRVAHVHSLTVAVADKPSSSEPVAAVAPAERKSPLAEATTLTEGTSVADIATSPLGDNDLVAILMSTVDDASKKDSGAELSTRIIDKNGVAQPASTVTARALPIGGVALAAAGKPDDGAVLAWVGRENGHAQVHVTKLDKRGKKTNDALLTTVAADASDVAIVKVKQGYLVAWVDTRNKNGEVYAAIVNPELVRISREERITNAPGDASDIALAIMGDNVVCVWADPRDSPDDGFADVYVAALAAHDAKKVGPETRLLATATHSRSPQIMAAGEKAFVAWVEDVPATPDATAPSAMGAMLAAVDAKGAIVAAPVRLAPSARGAAVSVTLGKGKVPFAIAARSSPDDVVLDWFDLSHEKPSAPVPLGVLDGPPAMDVSLATQGEALYFSDEGPRAKDRRARRLRVSLP